MYSEQDIQKFLDKVNEASKIAVIMHENPDLDAITSGTTLASFLKSKEKSVDVFTPSGISEEFFFVDGADEIKVLEEGVRVPDQDAYDMFVVVDANELSRVVIRGELEIPDNMYVVRIDHHENGEEFEDLRIQEITSSTAEILYEIFVFAKFEITPQIARSLMIGILSDTGWFAYRSTQSKTFVIISKLHEIYPRLPEIHHLLFDRYKKEYVQLWRLMMDKLQFDEERKLIMVHVLYEDASKFELDEEEFVIAKDIFVDDIMGRFGKFDASLVLYEIQKGTIRGSVRSNRGVYDCSKIADAYESGGGHKTAGGFRTSQGVEEVMKMFYEGMDKYRS